MAPEHTHQTEEDMISKLPDDLLLLILEKVNLSTAVKTSVLSKRWRNFPWLLTQLNIDIMYFFHEPRADPTDDQIHKAMTSLTEVVRSMMAPTRRKSIITKLCISLFLTNIYSNDIGDVVNEVVENGMVKDIELISGVERLPFDVPDDEMVKHADGINSFFGNYPKISCCLRNLILYNATFCKSDLHNLLANTCTELQYLYLYQCDTGIINPVFKIDAPNSKLNVLEFAYCSWIQVEVGCLPQLEQLILGHWSSPYLPLTLGCVPCLKEVDIYSGTTFYQKQPFRLSELLGGTTCITTLTLDFLGQKVWLKPEKYQLRSAFSKLRELLVHGIFVGFGLLWTTALLEAAPSLETLDIEVYDHLCGDDEEEKRLYGERTNAPWDVSEFTESSKSLPLRELKSYLLEL